MGCGLDHQHSLPSPSRFLVEEMDLSLSGQEMLCSGSEARPLPCLQE